MNFNLIQNPGLIKGSWINLINAYILIITILIGYFILIWFLFWSAKDTAKDVERFLLKNLTTACFLIVSLLSNFLLIWKLDKEFALTAVGAIIVFWYWYKTYERDKELEMFEKFNNGDLTVENFEEELNNLSHAFYMKERGYLPEYLWKRIDLKIDRLIFDFCDKNLKWKNINEFLENKNISNTIAKIKYEWWFIDYFIWKLESYIATAKDHEFSEEEKKEQEKITNLIIEIWQLLNPKK